MTRVMRLSADAGSSDASSSAADDQAHAAAVARAEQLWSRIPYDKWALVDSPSLKRHLRGGCPPALRNDVWFHISGGSRLAAAAAESGAAMYPSLARAGYAPPARDVPRSGAAPDAPRGGVPLARDSLRSAVSGGDWMAVQEESSPRCLPKAVADRITALPGGHAALQRVLIAYATSNPAAGALWRGAGAVAGLLLVVMRGDEERAYYTLLGLSDKLFSPYNGQAQLGVMVEARVLSSLVRSKLLRVHAHLTDNLGLSPYDLFAPWVSHCFVGALGSLEASARLFDCLLLEGPKVIHRVALAALSMFQGAALSCAHPAALPRVLEARLSKALSPPGAEGALVAAAFRRSVVGGMPGAALGALREAAAGEVRAQLEERRRRLALILA